MSNGINYEYYRWLCNKVSSGKFKSKLYNKLLKQLHSTCFIYFIDTDVNREQDGIDLRLRFAEENRYPKIHIVKCMEDNPCSVLEMMIALAIRIENSIMSDDEMGNRTSYWFWNMIDSLGLITMTDKNYNDQFVYNKIKKFLHRDYAFDGHGGLFTIPNTKKDLRNAEIWMQAMRYLSDVEIRR